MAAMDVKSGPEQVRAQIAAKRQEIERLIARGVAFTAHEVLTVSRELDDLVLLVQDRPAAASDG